MVEISSQINNIVNTIYRARGTQAIQESRMVAQGIGGIGRSLQQTSTLSDRFNSQWRAIGTTMRYAIAGGVIFGLARMVTQLKDVQQQLGLMQAIGQPAGAGRFSDNQITRLGNALQKSAQDSLTPINEVNDATINLLSTVQNVPGSEIPSIITNIGQAAKLSQTPIEDLTKAATTMNIAFGRVNNAQTIAQFNRMWFALIKTAPGGVSAAPEIANQLAPLASMFALGKGPLTGKQSQAQMFSDILGVLTTGSTPSTGMRGLTYLLQSLMQPHGQYAKALSSIGVTPESIAREGIQKNLLRFLGQITNTGNAQQIQNMSDDQIDLADQNGSLPGIPASEIRKLQQMIPRIHGIRAAVILAQRLRSTQQSVSLNQGAQMFGNAQDNIVSDSLNFAKAWDDVRKRSRLQEATIAIQRMRLQTAQAFEPILNLVTTPISKAAPLAAHHRTAVQIALMSALTVGGAFGIRRFLRGGGSNIARIEAARDIGSPGSGNSPENPLYVIVVGQLFNGPGSKGLLKNAENDITGGSTEARILKASIAARAATLAPSLLGVGLVAGTGAYILTHKGSGTPAEVSQQREQYFKNLYVQRAMKTNPRIKQFFDAASMTDQNLINPNWLRIMHQFSQGQISTQQLDKMLGRADVYMEIDVNQNGKVHTKRVHIPVDMWKNGKVPSTRGKKAVRSG